jgi:hypothetical protein
VPKIALTLVVNVYAPFQTGSMKCVHRCGCVCGWTGIVFAFAGLCQRLADQDKRTTEIKAVRHLDFLNGSYIKEPWLLTA